MTQARNWTETIIVALLCSLMLYTIRCLTGMAPEIMCYLIVGMKITMDIKEQRRREESPIRNQEDTSKIIRKKGIEVKNMASAEQSETRAPNDIGHKTREKESGKIKAHNLDAESGNIEDSY